MNPSSAALQKRCLIIVVAICVSAAFSAPDNGTIEREALLEFFSALGKPAKLNWNNLTNYCETPRWTGVFCESTPTTVTTIDLNSLGLSGTLSSALTLQPLQHSILRTIAFLVPSQVRLHCGETCRLTYFDGNVPVRLFAETLNS